MTVSTKLRELEEALVEKRTALKSFFDEHLQDGELVGDASVAEKARAMNDELTDLKAKWQSAKALVDMAAANAEELKSLGLVQRPQFPGQPESAGDRAALAARSKTLGELFIESAACKGWVSEDRPRGGPATTGADIPGIKSWRGAVMASLEAADRQYGMKATFAESGAGLTQYHRPPGIVLLQQQKLTIQDLLAKGQTEANTIRYVRETAFTNAATTVAEGATKPEATFATAEVDAPVRKIAVTAKVTEELFADFPAMRDYIDQRLPFMVQLTEENQLLTGSGVSPQITGILNVSGIQTQATGADTNPDAIYKGIVKVRTVGFFEPDGVVIHPNNWTPIRLLKTTTGEYVWGPPSTPGPEMIWGLPTDVTVNITANTALVGAYQLGAQVFYREGLRMEATNSNEDDFKKNLVAIRVEQREALAVYRPLAFCTVTGLA